MADRNVSSDFAVDTPAGPLVGVRRGDVAVWRGIPYAQRPDGELFCRPPVPVPAWTEPLDARHPGAAPPQPGRSAADERPPSGPGSYLTVDVWAPVDSQAARPVLVWLCVGGNVVGSSAWPLYDGSHLVRRGLVVVTVNARLGPEGFTVLDDAPDNRAAMDWIAALKWVRGNVGAFGGDPAAVTLGGQSAGAGATAALLTSPCAAGLFARAIVMSATTPSLDRDLAIRDGRRVLDSLGIAPTRRDLAGVPEEELVRATAGSFGPGWRVEDPVQRVRNMLVGPPFRLVADPALGIGDVLPASRRGAGASVPVLTGTTSGEFTAQFAALETLADDAVLDEALGELGPAASDGRAAYRARYPQLSPGGVLGQAFTDAVFRLSSDRFALARLAGGGTSFVYEFGPLEPGSSEAHGADVPHVFGTAPASAGARPALGQAVQEAVARFVTTGDPGWDPYDQRRTVQRFTADGGAPETDAFAWERRIWGSARGWFSG